MTPRLTTKPYDRRERRVPGLNRYSNPVSRLKTVAKQFVGIRK